MSSADQILHYVLADTERYAGLALKIKDKSGGIVPLVFNSAQRYIHQRMEEQRRRQGWVRAVVLKGRQQGSSTYITARHFKRVSTERGRRAYILTHEQQATDNLFDMVDRYYRNLPPVIKPHAGTSSAKELYFDKLDSGYAIGTAGTKGTGRSSTFQLFHGSEVAHWPNAADHMAGVGQAVPLLPDTEIVLESTANGIGNVYHRSWLDAAAGRSDYCAIFVPWFWQMEYRRTVPHDFQLDADEQEYADAFGLDAEQMYWRRKKIIDDFKGDIALFDQEYPATPEHAFMSAGADTLIMPVWFARARRTRIVDVGEYPKLWGLDVAEYGDDRSALAKRQGRRWYGQQFWAKRGPMELVGLLGIAYEREPEPKPEAIMVDTTGIGSGVADRATEMGLPIVRINFGEKAFEEERYKIRRDEMWGDMRDWFRDIPNSIEFDGEDADACQADCTAPTYKYDSSRRLMLESKEHMRNQRGLPSPDGGDAFALTFAYKGITTKGKSKIRRQNEDWRTL